MLSGSAGLVFPSPLVALSRPPTLHCTRPGEAGLAQHLVQVLPLKAFGSLGPGPFNLSGTVSIKATFVFG